MRQVTVVLNVADDVDNHELAVELGWVEASGIHFSHIVEEEDAE